VLLLLLLLLLLQLKLLQKLEREGERERERARARASERVFVCLCVCVCVRAWHDEFVFVLETRAFRGAFNSLEYTTSCSSPLFRLYSGSTKTLLMHYY
jgi:hypothetical protein